MHPVEHKLAAVWPPEAWQDVTVLMAVSGGADSVAMLRAMRALKVAGPGRLVVAHFNHQLRGAESAADEEFVAALCRDLDLACETGRGQVAALAGREGDGLEAAARQARYHFLQATAERQGARYVVTGHTADDQAETVLHRVIRGTGLAGLAGMPRARKLGKASTLIRPFLEFRRDELVAYLDALGQPYRDDSSNADTRFTRNRIRHELLPHLAEAYNPGAREAILRLGTLAGEAQAILDRLASDLRAQCVRQEADGSLVIDASHLADEPRYLVREVLIAAWTERNWPLQSMGLAQWELLADMIARAAAGQTSPKEILPGNIAAEIREGCLRMKSEE
ncbi:MAG: tRNA lysidine(34) synthetase TilS [Pirellulales bacterium]